MSSSGNALNTFGMLVGVAGCSMDFSTSAKDVAPSSPEEFAAATGLEAGDVNITEDGVACKTLKVEPVDWPIKVQVLVDNGKGNTTPINPLRDGLAATWAALQPLAA